MDYEWDETKRRADISKHRLDFRDVPLVFERAHLLGEAKASGDETRHLATGKIEDVYVTIIFAWRGRARRVISMRRAHGDEPRRYEAIFGS